MGEDIDKLKKEKLKELKSQKDSEEAEKKRKEQMEKQKKLLLKKYLTSDARSRLSNLRMARPDFTERIELQLIQLARSGRIETPITDDQLRKLLKKLQQDKTSIDIKRR